MSCILPCALYGNTQCLQPRPSLADSRTKRPRTCRQKGDRTAYSSLALPGLCRRIYGHVRPFGCMLGSHRPKEYTQTHGTRPTTRHKTGLDKVTPERGRDGTGLGVPHLPVTHDLTQAGEAGSGPYSMYPRRLQRAPAQLCDAERRQQRFRWPPVASVHR